LLGSVLFTVGGSLEVYHNDIRAFKCDSVVHWLSLSNCLGGLLFLLAAFSGMVGVEDYERLVAWPYLLGSCSFLVGALLALWMWKDEHYGLGLISEINVTRSAPDGAAGAAGAGAAGASRASAGERELETSPTSPSSPSLRMSGGGGGGGGVFPGPQQLEAMLLRQREYGCGRSDIWQLPFLVLYVVNSCGAVVSLAIAHQHHAPAERILTGLLDIALSHCVLLLGSVLHHTPEAQPHRCMLQFARLIMLLYAFSNWYHVVTTLQKE
jgi:hypothetical protein